MKWRIAVDRGGTFTDVVATAPDGRHIVRKVPSADAESPLAAIREVLDLAPGARIPAALVESVRCGTTVATNALLERRGERCVLFVTQGFGDLLRIGTQARPDLFALRIVLPEPLPERIVEVAERRLADGTVRQSLDDAALRCAAETARRDGFDSAAVLFLHSYRYPEHESAAGDVLRAAGFPHVTLSHEAAREVKALPRGETACADAYLTPLLRRSLGRFADGFEPGVDLRFLQSDGGLADVAHASGPRAVLSGPAGGVVATGAVARLAGEERAIGFDMGGTSTDVCRWAGEAEREYETRVAGVRLRVPSLRIVTVASGGGSRLGCDGRRLLAGPQSVGAVPGPAGYGVGEDAALTDANAVLGRLVPARFPRCFGPSGDRPFDVAASRRAVGALAERAGLGQETAAAGFVRVAVERMAQAIRELSTARGHDVRDHALVCFGGAGAQHACALARALGIRRVLLHPLGSVLSAWGIGLARAAHEEGAAVLAPWDDDGHRAASAACDALERDGRARLAAEGVAEAEAARLVELRYVGVDATTVVPLGSREATHAAFEEAHRRLYGFARAGHPVEVVNARVRVEESAGGEPQATRAAEGAATPLPESRKAVWFETEDGLRALDTPVVDLGALGEGASRAGPALLVDDVTTVVVEPGWRARREGGLLVVEAEDPPALRRAGTGRDPLFLALFANAFMSVAERMGAVLERVSLSTNIKERLDFSCAVFDAGGRLVANAPHIPVHLGAMGESVRAIVAARGSDLRDGDAIVTNDPFHGGSHLPDVTVVTPVLVRDGRARFFVANRAHHADVGGITPGSMPPLSRTIDDEGVCVHDLLLVRDGVLHEDAARAAFGGGPHPARALDERLADLRAQVAANVEGARLLRALAEESGEDVVRAYMGHVLDDAAAAMREMLRGLPDGEHAFEDALDDGTPLRVTVTVRGERAIVDFAGTGPRSSGNLNAPHAVTRAAVLFALRTLIGRDVPLNEGCLRPIEVRIPEGSLLDPVRPCAVVGGNVETSMRLVDVVLAALGAAAGSQGTMNNVTFGRPRTGDAGGGAYYETIGGGSGAGPDFDGADAVQVHMTNTRITDPEIVELRWPVVVRRFAIRRGSGGEGAHRGGDGAVREIEFLASMEGGILSQRRTAGAFGLAGGAPGAPGRNVHVRDGVETELPGRAALALRAGDVLRIETPGGGGYGTSSTPGPCAP